MLSFVCLPVFLTLGKMTDQSKSPSLSYKYTDRHLLSWFYHRNRRQKTYFHQPNNQPCFPTPRQKSIRQSLFYGCCFTSLSLTSPLALQSIDFLFFLQRHYTENHLEKANFVLFYHKCRGILSFNSALAAARWPGIDFRMAHHSSDHTATKTWCLRDRCG